MNNRKRYNYSKLLPLCNIKQKFYLAQTFCRMAHIQKYSNGFLRETLLHHPTVVIDFDNTALDLTSALKVNTNFDHKLAYRLRKEIPIYSTNVPIIR